MAVRQLSIKPLSGHSVVSDFVSTYTKVWKTQKLPSKVDPLRVLNLRASQLPFCPVDFFIRYANRGLYGEMDMGMAYYVSVGSTVHEVLQRYLGTSGRFLADWHCKVCNKWKRLTHDNMCCDTHMEYHEVLIDCEGLVGHIDAIYRDKQGNYWILDFKTTSTARAPKVQKNPGRVYIEQIESYALFLKLQYGISVKGVILAFIKRDNPMVPVLYTQAVDIEHLKGVRKRIKGYRRRHRDALDARTKDDVLELLEYGKCTNPDCKTCGEGKAYMKREIIAAYKRGKANGRLPIRAMAEAALSDAQKAKRKAKASA